MDQAHYLISWQPYRKSIFKTLPRNRTIVSIITEKPQELIGTP